MKLTREMIESCRSDRGSFTIAAAQWLGAEIPLSVGWPERLVGREISDADFANARAYRNPRPRGEPRSWRKGQTAFDL
jgi:hypothetical protein